MDNYLYEYDGKLYINLTNECSNDCAFCVRNTSDGVGGYFLWLKKPPTADEIIKKLEETDLGKYREFVFCGFGEPLCAFSELVKVGEFLRAQGKRVRLNTNGQARLIVGDNAAERLKNAVDTVSISLNAPDAKKYNAVCRCAFGDDGYYAMLEFAKQCVKCVDRVILSVVDTIPQEDIEACRKIAENMGAEFRVRKYEA
ncbi:MAG: TatD family nuclease-associated radical SAM protein [Clostridiales bacterium]|jgi:TatD family-associated radical SAM protein|nr:TatD family nuclease-associated radical SAM protein [Clostridiales bacterium]